MIILQNITHIHPSGDSLFDGIYWSINHREKWGLIGNNGSGKSTLLRIIAGEIPPQSGTVQSDGTVYYVPQLTGQYDSWTIARAMGVDVKLNAMQEILNGNATEENLLLLDDDWSIEERCNQALEYWQLKEIHINEKMCELSGGQKTKVLLAGIAIHQPDLVLLDEPSNHLDAAGRQLLYDFVRTYSGTLLVVSHDRTLLNVLDTICELGPGGCSIYGGNYDFYVEQKNIGEVALLNALKSTEKAFRKAKEREREVAERQQKLESRGKRKQTDAGVARIMMNTLRNSAESSSTKLRNVHSERIDEMAEKLHELRSSVPERNKMKFGFENTSLHKGKVLFRATRVNYNYGNQPVWKAGINLEVLSGERVALQGNNGSGKTTLMKLLLGSLQPTEGDVYRAITRSVYMDQGYSLLDDHLTVYEQAQAFNESALAEHEIRTRLDRFLFPREDWGKQCRVLSGGERMRLLLCCMTIHHQSPDIIVLDEPTNNLDLENLQILTAALNEYDGTIIVSSHDQEFLKEIEVERTFSVG